MKTLYISDLDGTLLNPSAEVTPFTQEILNQLVNNNFPFTIATARSASTVVPILQNLNISLPVILMNGVAIFDLRTKTYIDSFGLDQVQSKAVLEVLNKTKVPAFVYDIQGDKLLCYAPSFLNESMREFRIERETQYNKIFTPFESYEDLYENDVIYFTLVGSEEELKETYELVKEIGGVEALFYEDVYTDNSFLEIYARGVSKGRAAKRIQELVSAERLFVFGDNLNDVSLFEAADYAIATQNAKEELKQLADECIGSNAEQSVARYLARFLDNDIYMSQIQVPSSCSVER